MGMTLEDDISDSALRSRQYQVHLLQLTRLAVSCPEVKQAWQLEWFLLLLQSKALDVERAVVMLTRKLQTKLKRGRTRPDLLARHVYYGRPNGTLAQ